MGKKKDNGQIDLFADAESNYKITKPLRIISFFSGIGFQEKGIISAFPNTERHKCCEWAIPSILGYDAIWNGKQDEKCYITDKELLIDKLVKLGVSLDYNQPADRKQIARLDLRKLNRINTAIERNHNLVNIMSVKGSDLDITDTDTYEYILFYSFPCQDLSLAGLGKGMSVSQAEGGTRSGLVWEIIRILNECENKPNILICENVPQLHSTDNCRDFHNLQVELNRLGYVNFWEDMNCKDYTNIPQNRNRTFMVSIYDPTKQTTYSFPLKQPLTRRLKDLLEDNVDEKYYLSDAMVEYIVADNEKWTGNNDKALVNKDIGCCLNTKPDGRRCDASNYIADDLPENTDLKRIGGLHDKDGKSHQAGSIYDIDGLAPTLDCATGGQRQPYIVETNNKALNETLEQNEIQDGTFIDAYNRAVNDDVAGTIKTTINTSNMTFVAEKYKEFMNNNEGKKDGNTEN